MRLVLGSHDDEWTKKARAGAWLGGADGHVFYITLHVMQMRATSYLAEDLGHDTRADSLAALTQGEARTLLERNVVHKVTH